MKKLLIVILLLAMAGMAAAQTQVYDIMVPDSAAIKNIETIRLNAVVDSVHRYDIAEWVKKSKYDQLAAENKKLMEITVKQITELLQFIEPGVLRAWQLVNDTTMAIVPKKDLPKKLKERVK